MPSDLAIHEAAHVILCRALGGTVENVWIDPVSGTGRATFSQLPTMPLLNRLAITLAGPVAVLMHNPQTKTKSVLGEYSDIPKVRAMMEPCRKSHGNRAVDEVIHQAAALAERILFAWRNDLLKLAAQLDTHHWLGVE